MCDFTIVNQDQKRRADAGSKLVKKIKIEGSTGIIKGSGKNPYTVTLDRCSCGDYIRHHEPCKHMFALAYKLGVKVA